MSQEPMGQEFLSQPFSRRPAIRQRPRTFSRLDLGFCCAVPGSSPALTAVHSISRGVEACYDHVLEPVGFKRPDLEDKTRRPCRRSAPSQLSSACPFSRKAAKHSTFCIAKCFPPSKARSSSCSSIVTMLIRRVEYGSSLPQSRQQTQPNPRPSRCGHVV